MWKSLYNISLKYALFYLWVFYWINLKCTSPGFATEWEVILFSFFIFNFGNSAEIRTLTMVWTQNGKWEGESGWDCPACLYVYFRTFFKCKSCTFLGSSEFLLFPFFLQAFCSELLLYIANNLKEYKNMWSSFKKTTV